MDLLSQDILEGPGEYLRLDRAYYREVRGKLNIAQSSLRKLFETPESAKNTDLIAVNRENWAVLQDECEKVLNDRSRDVEIFSWWLAALSYRADGLFMLERGLSDFVECFKVLGDTMQPTLPLDQLKSEDAIGQKKEICDTQTRPLIQLVGESLTSGLLNPAISQFDLIDGFTLNQFSSLQRSGATEETAPQMRDAVQADMSSAQEKYVAIAAIHQQVSVLAEQVNLMRESSQLARVGFNFTLAVLDEAKSMFDYYGVVFSAEKTEPAIGGEPANHDAASTEKGNVMDKSAGSGYQRSDALRELQRIALFFRDTEPHSPIPYILVKAVRWGHMSFPELLSELIQENPSVLSEISKLTGLDVMGSFEAIPRQDGAVQGSSRGEVEGTDAGSVPDSVPDVTAVESPPEKSSW